MRTTDFGRGDFLCVALNLKVCRIRSVSVRALPVGVPSCTDAFFTAATAAFSVASWGGQPCAGEVQPHDDLLYYDQASEKGPPAVLCVHVCA